jgi:cysteine desulfurase
MTVRSVYLDYSASTPTDPRVVAAMLPYFSEVYGNPSSSHTFGRKAEQAIEDARERVARALNCKPSEIVFTGGGSESDNLAIRGAAWAGQRLGKGRHVITTPVEHSAVSRTCRQLHDVMGFDVTTLPVDRYGIVDEEDFANACVDGTTIASMIYANNEIGSINPIPRLAAQAHQRGALFHTDAVQAAGQVTLDVQQLGVDLLSLSAHKFYGPKGVGALYVREGVDLVSAQTGGSHEEGRRAGTHNTPGIVGLGVALELAEAERDARTTRYRELRDLLIGEILRSIPDAELTGHPENRLPAHASFIFDGVDSVKLLMHLDTRGIAASGGSACKTGNPEPSGVLMAMGYTEKQAIANLRLSVGLHTTEDEIAYAVPVIAETVAKLRKLNRMLPK